MADTRKSYSHEYSCLQAEDHILLKHFRLILLDAIHQRYKSETMRLSSNTLLAQLPINQGKPVR